MLREVGEAYMRFQHLLQSTQELVLVFGRQLFQRPIDVDIKDDRVINELIRLQQLHPSATGVSLIAGGKISIPKAHPLLTEWMQSLSRV
jgi:hypothetical protein